MHNERWMKICGGLASAALGLAWLAMAPAMADVPQYAASLNGSNQFLLTSAALDESGARSYTLEAWLWPRSLGGPRHALSTDIGAGQWSLVQGTNHHWLVYRGQNQAADTGFLVDTSRWQHLAVVFDKDAAAVRVVYNTNVFTTVGPWYYTNAPLNLLVGARVATNDYGAPPLAGLALWLSADVGAQGMAAAITNWLDRSGAGRHVRSTGPGAGPTLVSNTPAGRPALRFDGTNDSLAATSAFSLRGLTGVTVFVVAAPGNAQGVAGCYHSAVAWSGDDPARAFYTPGGYTVDYAFGAGAGSIYAYNRAASALGDWEIGMAVHAGTTNGLWINGTNVQAAASAAVIPSTNSAFWVGRGWSNTFFQGDIAEILVYTNTLTAAQILAADTYLRAKYWQSAWQTNCFFHGWVDDVRVWQTARSATQVAAQYTNALYGPAEAGLMMYYMLDEGVGNFVFDTSTNQLHGVLVNAASNSWVAGVPLNLPTGYGLESVGLWVGAASLNLVNRPVPPGAGSGAWDGESVTNAGGTFPLQLLVHLNTNREAYLLQRVVLAGYWTNVVATNAAGAAILTNQVLRYRLYADESRVPADALYIKRISSVGFSLMAPAPLAGWPLANATVPLAARDPANPFVHAYHPDFGATQNVVAVTRQISMLFLPLDPDDPGNPFWNVSESGGIYREMITGLHANPLYVEGTFYLNKVNHVGVLE